MNVPLGEVVYFDVIASDPTTGAASDADSTPSFEVFEESTDTDIGVGGNLTKRTSKTGNYRGSFTASSGNGFEAGKWYNVIVSATVGAIAGKCVAMRFRAVVAEGVAGEPVVDVAHVEGSDATTYFDGLDDAVLTAIAALPSASDVVTALLAEAYEGAETFQDFLRLARAALYGLASGAETTEITYYGEDEATERIIATVDSYGNRSAATLDAS